MCDNGRTIRRDDIERRVLAGLTDKLASPEAVAVAVCAYAEETNRQNHERRAQVEASRRALEKIERGTKASREAAPSGQRIYVEEKSPFDISATNLGGRSSNLLGCAISVQNREHRQFFSLETIPPKL
jgi:hypothetical protein